MDVDCGINNVDCNHIQNQDSRTNVSFWRSAANYTRMDCGVKHFGKSVVVKQFPNRAGSFRCATMEEIEAEKSLIEKDTVSLLLASDLKVNKGWRRVIETVRSNFNSVRTNRANPSMLDRVEYELNVPVDYYGSPVSLKSIAQISTPDASSILISPYDKSSEGGHEGGKWGWVVVEIGLKRVWVMVGVVIMGGGDDVWNWWAEVGRGWGRGLWLRWSGLLLARVGMGHGVGQSHRQGRLGWGWVVTGVVGRVGVGRVWWWGGRSVEWVVSGQGWGLLGEGGLGWGGGISSSNFGSKDNKISAVWMEKSEHLNEILDYSCRYFKC
ncbi:Ribosome-recycling factor chloroplastic [Bienertia sinuspersici]